MKRTWWWWLSPRSRGVRENVDDSFPACAFCGDEFAHNNSTLLSQDQSTLAQRAETTVAKYFLASCVWARFPDRFPHSAWTASWALRLLWIKVFRCNLPPAFLTEWPESFTTAVTLGGTDTEYESAQKANSGEENSPAAPARTRTRNLSITSSALYQNA